MERGWDARGLLAPLWRKYPGGRDALAQAVGTTGSALSSRNSGNRTLGMSLGRRLADELGVSVQELGAPLEMPDPGADTLRRRLAELEVEQRALRVEIERARGAIADSLEALNRGIEQLSRRLDALDAAGRASPRG